MTLSVNIFNFLQKTVKSDMAVYKILSSASVKLRSMHYGYEYTVGQLVHSPLVRERFTIYDGFHSFPTLKSAQDELDLFKFLSPGIDIDISNVHIYKATIPAGSKYYTGQYRNCRTIASNQIIIESKLCASV